MIQLRILGPPGLDGVPGGEPADLLAQPKRLALLAYLATASGRSLIGRDKLLALFWPELPEERARHALSQALHVLRRSLEPETIVTHGERLGIDTTRLWCDAVAFQQALRHGERAKALELYRGALLDGLFLGDAPEFERWLEDTRAAYQGEAGAVAAGLAQDAVTAGDPRAVSLARRATELARYDSAPISRLVALLDAEGNPSAAIAAYDAFRRRLLDDCALHPSAELKRRVDAIRARTAAAIPPLELAAEPVAAEVPATSLPKGSPLLRLAVAFALILLAGGGFWFSRGSRPLLHASRTTQAGALARVAVLPFAGDSLGRSVVELLASRLDGAGSIHVLPSDSVLAATRTGTGDGLAKRLAASSVVEGKLTETGHRLHLRASWVRTQDRAVIAEATAEGDERAFYALLDSLAVQLLARSQPDALDHLAAITSPSLGSLKAFLQGEAAFSEGRFAAASRAFEQASQDSNFALAQYRLGVAALWAEDYPLAALDAGARALRHSAHLPQHTQRLLKGFDAWRQGDTNGALSALLSVVASDRDNLEAWFQLGETLFHYNASRGRPVADSRDAFEQTLRLDPNHWGALWHLALLDALQGRTADLDRRVDHLLNLGPRTDYWLELTTLRACAHRNPIELARLNDSLRMVGEGRLIDLTWRCAVYGRNVDAVEQLARLMLERRQVGFTQVAGRSMLATVAIAHGRRTAALAQVDSIAEVSRSGALRARSDLALLPLLGATREEIAKLDQAWDSMPPPPGIPGWPMLRASMRGRLEAALGQAEAAAGRARELDAMTDQPGERGLGQALAREIRALLAGLGTADGLRALEVDDPTVWFGIQVSSALAGRVSARFERAEALDRMGRSQEALRWYGSLDELSFFDLIYSGPVQLRRAEILERLGESSAAAAEYSRFLELWKNADPELQPLVAQARERLTRLSAHR